MQPSSWVRSMGMMPEFACVRPSMCAGMRMRLPLDPSFRVVMVSMLVSSGGNLGVLRLRHGQGKWADDGDDDNMWMHCTRG